jgi:hypothetical protein
MEFIAAVGHIHHIAKWLFWQWRTIFRKQKSLFMLIAKEPALRTVALAKDYVPDRLKSCAASRFEECIDLCPPVKTLRQRDPVSERGMLPPSTA